MAVVTVKKDYQIQIPYDLREKVAINKGDRLILEMDKKGSIIINKFNKGVVEASFGIWAGEKDGVEYVDKIRDEEEKRLEEMGIEKGTN